MMNQLEAVFFDLDGTLLDTAPDLGYALNQLLIAKQRTPIQTEQIRAYAGHGGRKLIQLGFNIDIDHPEFTSLWQQFLLLYSQNISRETNFFPGMSDVIAHLKSRQIPWGIVTNKPTDLTELLLADLNLNTETKCVVCGDTLKKRKPDPAPLFYACDLLGVSPQKSLFIGDAAIDVEAGKQAGMQTVVAAYGYLSHEDIPQNWQADGIIQSPAEIISWIC